jgi:hypothetical protein
MRKKYFDHESAFAHIWNNADDDGIWAGNAKKLAAKFRVKEDESHDMLSELCDRGLIERVGTETYIVSRWREGDDLGDKELRWWEFTAGLRHR